MQYDDGSVLGSNQLGAYVYKKEGPVGIYFNKVFRTLQQHLGDGFTAATLFHETGHAHDDACGHLNPKEVKKGEEVAFKTEYLWLRTLDPSGQKLAWARHKYCVADTGSPEMVCKYLKHLAMILDYGSKDDFAGLVDHLGYQDREEDPFAHDHSSDDAENEPNRESDDGMD